MLIAALAKHIKETGERVMKKKKKDWMADIKIRQKMTRSLTGLFFSLKQYLHGSDQKICSKESLSNVTLIKYFFLLSFYVCIYIYI